MTLREAVVMGDLEAQGDFPFTRVKPLKTVGICHSWMRPGPADQGEIAGFFNVKGKLSDIFLDSNLPLWQVTNFTR